MWKHSNAWRAFAWIINLFSLILGVLSVIVFIIVYGQNYSLHREWTENVSFIQSEIFMNEAYTEISNMNQSISYTDLPQYRTINSDSQNLIICIDDPNGIITNGDERIVEQWMQQSREFSIEELNSGDVNTNFFYNNNSYQLVSFIRTTEKGEQFESYYALDTMITPTETLMQGNNQYSSYVFLDPSFHGQDTLARFEMFYSVGQNVYRVIIGTIPIQIILYIISLIYLIISAGHKKGTGEIVLKRHDKIPGEIIFIMLIAASVFGIGFSMNLLSISIYDALYDSTNYSVSILIMEVIPMITILTISYLFSMILLMRMIRRKKAGISYWDTSIFHIVIRKAETLYNEREEVGRLMMLLVGGLVSFFISFILIGAGGIFSFVGVIGVICIPIIVLKQMLEEAVWRNQIYKGINAIVEGKTGYKINTSKMKSNEKKAGEQINHLGEGLQRAVVEATKNERLKAELITNVSHDIKTPLTSIINYVDLIKRENIDNPKIKEYVKVLDEKSQRLKHLTEDLVEASKANTGNLTLNMEKIDFMQLIYQTLGEFQDKFEERQLKTVVKLDKSPVWIYADGRRVWRVMENLFQNVYKYAMPQTRVYIESVTTSKKTVVTVKNISENPLNIPASELTERFIRGDVARTTEGSGLGLSIAKSLMELMNGEFELYLDGDLFRASVGFDRMGVEEAKKEKSKEEETKKEEAFDWEAFMKKSNNEEEEKQEETKQSKQKTENPLKRQKITLISMWKNLGYEMKNLSSEVKNFNLKEKK